jgi:raffinose/stachyose/melibiose transport system substrate-binding protein
MRKYHFSLIAAFTAMSLLLSVVVHAQDAVTLTVLIHQNPPMVDFMNDFNAKFQEANPNITVDMAVVNNSDLSTTTQTRLSANDIDVIDVFGFANAVQPYMKDATPPELAGDD